MVIYLDLIIGLNILFNFFILLLTNYLARAGKKIFRILLGSIFASMIVPLYLLISDPIVHSIGFKAMYSLLIIYCTFGYNGLYTFMKRISLFYFTTFAIGGGLIGLHFMFEEIMSKPYSKLLVSVHNVYGDQISLVLLLVGFLFLLLFTKRRMDRHTKDKLQYDQLYQVIIEMNEEIHRTTGYIDSGNQLVDPLTNRPVVICDADYLQLFFTESEWKEIEHAIRSDDVTKFPQSMRKKLFIVPYQGVDGQTGYLYTVRPDRLNVLYMEEELTTDKVLIGIQLADLTVNQQYHCLLHPELIQLKMKITA